MYRGSVNVAASRVSSGVVQVVTVPGDLSLGWSRRALSAQISDVGEMNDIMAFDPVAGCLARPVSRTF
jgi:hypothetical protein